MSNEIFLSFKEKNFKIEYAELKVCQQLFVVEQLMCWKEIFLIQQKETYQSICKSIFITTQNGFEIKNKVEIMSYKCQNNFELNFCNIVQRCFNFVSKSNSDVISIVCKIENPTSNFVSFSTTDQRYFNVDLQR